MPRESKTKLFHNKVIEKYIKSITISSKQREALNLWVDKLKKKELIEERSNYPIFQKYIVEDILGYSVEDFDFEKGNVEFTIKNQSGKPLLVLELKGQETDLFSKQSTGVTPYKQAFLYAVEKGTEYFATCNYSQIVFFLKENNYSRYEILDFQEMSKNENEFKKFILLFSKEYLVKRNIPALLKTDTIQEEKELTKEFYKIYHETRLMIIKELEVECKLSKEKAIHYSQIFLNRIMFICFAQDSEKHLLEPLILENTILKPIEKEMVGEHTHYIWESLVNLFRSINLGDRIHNIPKYNGGLFSEDIPNDVKIRDFPVNQKYFNELNQGSKYSEKDINITILQRMGKYRTEINPIYKNLLLISSFDFKTDINVNILGHIFEQSIGDIEDLLSQNVSQRKKFGVFYTPEYITEYISRSAIIPYLSKTGNAKDIDELIYEYYNDLDKLEDKVKKIKILDPACGSGAFLNKTVDVLLEIHRAIYETKLQKGKYKTTVEERHKRKKIEVEMESITLYFDDIEQQREIILNNIFGVDINEESVEITKLSLFLKIAARNIVLPNLDNNIKCGNSLIDDPAIAGDKAFKWEEKFPEVMKEGGFDIVIGNPPYFKIFEDDPINKTETYLEIKSGMMNAAAVFINKALYLVKTGGDVGMIVPKMLAYTNSWDKIRRKILHNYTLIKIVDAGKAFEGVLLEQIIFILKKTTKKDNEIIIGELKEQSITETAKIPQSLCVKDNRIYLEPDEHAYIIKEKMEKSGVFLGDISDINLGLGIQGKSFFYDEYKPGYDKVLRGDDIQRYLIRGSKFYDPKERGLSPYTEYIKKMKRPHIVVQRIVAHIKDHIKITAAYDEEGLFSFNTVTNIFVRDKKYPDLFILALLNSNAVQYYTYKFIYQNAIRSMDFYKAYAEKIPLPKLDPSKYERIESLVREINSLHKLLGKNDNSKLIEERIRKINLEINELIADLYDLSEKDKLLINKNLD